MIDFSAVSEIPRLVGRYTYERIGYDQRHLDLLADGIIGEGSAGFERLWYPSRVGDVEFITIAGELGVLCTARRIDERTFVGDWVRCHPCSVRLSKVSDAVDESIRPQVQFIGETSKAQPRRLRSGWFDRFAPPTQSGIDIGCGYDPLNTTFRRWDVQFGDGDATEMAGIADESFFTVYSSHLLEHLHRPEAALANWWRILKPGGCLVVVVPHRDLFEMRTLLPSMGNPDHKWFYLPEHDEAPHTIGLRALLQRVLPGASIEAFSVEDSGYRGWNSNDGVFAIGEYSIEAVLRKA